MADEAPEGQSQDPGATSEPEAAWWPWPETHADGPTGPRDGAPGADETLSLPIADDTVPMAVEPAAAEPTRPVEAPEPVEPTLAVELTEPEPEATAPPERPAPEPEPAPVLEAKPLDSAPTSVVDTRPVAPVPAPPAVVGGATAALAHTTESPWVMAVATDDAEPPNEAVPTVAPAAGTGPVGSIPAAHARAVWSRVQASNWRLFLIRFLSAGLAVVLTVVIVPGLGFVGWRWGDFLRIAVIFGLLNATVKPLLQFLVLRFIFSTYGIVVVVINTLLLVLLATILEDTFEASRPLSVLFGGLVVGVLGLVFETLLGATPPTLDRDYKERNGLS